MLALICKIKQQKLMKKRFNSEGKEQLKSLKKKIKSYWQNLLLFRRVNLSVLRALQDKEEHEIRVRNWVLSVVGQLLCQVHLNMVLNNFQAHSKQLKRH